MNAREVKGQQVFSIRSEKAGKFMGVNFEGFAVLYDGIIIKPLPPSLNHITCHMKEKGEMTVLAATLSFPQTTTGGEKVF